MCKININGVNITLTEHQLEEIDKQRNKKDINERITTIQDVFNELREDYSIFKLPYPYPNNNEEKSANAYVLLLKITRLELV